MPLRKDKSMTGKSTQRRLLHPYDMNSLTRWIEALRLYGGISPRNLDKALLATALSMITSPLRLAERALFRPRIESTTITQPPLFILGHWRTGTTFLHSLLTQDQDTGYVTLFQTLAPDAFFVGQKTLQPLLALRAPKTRPMDNVLIEMEGPQEEEFAMAHSSGLSFYVGWYFPDAMEQLFEKYALLDGLSGDELADWQSSYTYLLKAATRHADGKRLVVKNPVNTCRIGALLELFPDAKFVHICRDPYAVYKSALHLFHSVLDLVSLQTIDDAQIERYVLKFYRRMMKRYLEERGRIPAGNLVEVRYEDLVADPVAETDRIYAELGLPGWEAAREDVRAYAHSQRGYAKNLFAMRPRDIQKVEEHWKFVIDAWGYPRPCCARETRSFSDASAAK